MNRHARSAKSIANDPMYGPAVRSKKNFDELAASLLKYFLVRNISSAVSPAEQIVENIAAQACQILGSHSPFVVRYG